MKMNYQEFDPVIVAFLCTWCSYAGADLAGTSRIQYPSNLRVIKVPCSSRIDPLFIFHALQKGADGVLISGCHPGDCHYLTGNYYARKRFLLIHEILDQIGIEPDRVKFSWISAAEGLKFAAFVGEYTMKIKKLGPLNQLSKELISLDSLMKEPTELNS
ncbi:MAG: methyl-viologen-reducing hydrogenase subunit delta [Candidatus Schekmanbacteria bacterium RBG_13_48_7]|uniref:Methyl-viologen-reducing hydrogenase subunit delta n=1 Tax=Candidatus Schekmanbacteria bacterium RBG_13_48_7 TaxID=1817878 RepID=A0A1F7S183_9BACT|nr:MAG: methyl-viologen-reducing hydrogenase subunit delta [Candidatus Schekmanbacteria bacterium RBG_13_48_7]